MGAAASITDEARFSKYRFVFTANRNPVTKQFLQLSMIKLYGYNNSTGELALASVNNPDGESPGAGEGPSNLLDGSTKTKWLDLKFSVNGQSVLVIELKEPALVGAYELFTANDDSNRDPSAWTFEVERDGKWQKLDQRYEMQAFVPEKRFASNGRLKITDVRKSASSIQMNNVLLPPPEEVRDFIDFNDCRGDFHLAVAWAREALVAAGEDKEVKKEAIKLLSTKFSLELGNPFRGNQFEYIKDELKKAANEIGKPMAKFYSEENLEVLGKWDLSGEVLGRRAEFMSSDGLRLDNPAVGLPNLFEGKMPGEITLEMENQFIHLVRLIAMAVAEDFHKTCEDIHNVHSGEWRKPKIKGDARMRNKCLSSEDHLHCLKPRPAHNIDIVRGCGCLPTAADLQGCLQDMVKKFGAPVRTKNMFSWDLEMAEKQLHYRTFMANWLFDAGMTYGELCRDQRVKKLWEAYIDALPENPNVSWPQWHYDASRALEILHSDAIASLPVKFICETQLLLPPYLFGRGKLHLLYKVVRAEDANQLFKDCRIEFAVNTNYAAPTFTAWQAEGVAAMESWMKREFGGQSGDPNNYHGDGDSLLRRFASAGQTAALERFLEAGCDPNGKLGRGLSQYNHLIHRSDVPTPLMDAVKFGNVEAVKILCKYGAALDICVDEGTALTCAAEQNHSECCIALLAAGASPSQPGKGGETPAEVAQRCGSDDVAALLRRYVDA